VVLLSAVVLAPAAVAAQDALPLRVALIAPAGDCSALDAEELEATLRAYLADVSAEVVSTSAVLERAPFDEVRGQALVVAEEQGAGMVVWCQGGRQGELLLHVLDVRGDTALVRTVDLGHEADDSVPRTMAAVVRTVVDSGMLDRAAHAEEESPPAPAPTVEAAPEDAPGSPRRPAGATELHLGAGVSYVLRLREEPGPAHHAVGARVWLHAVDWLLVAAGGRFAPPVDAPAQEGGAILRAAAVAGVGVGHHVGPVLLGAMVLLDLEWLWGEAEVGDGSVRDFSHLGVGVSVDLVVAATLWQGLELRLTAGATVRPDEVVFLMHGEEVAGSGHLEGGIEIGLGWQFL